MKKITTIIALTLSICASAQLNTILNFSDTTGTGPSAALIFDGTFLYGTTEYGGAYGNGVLFKINPDGTGYTDLMDFNLLNGSQPYGALYYDGSFLYGMTSLGGTNNQGIIFKIKPDGTSYVKLLDFDSLNGTGPFGALISDGNFLYGMTAAGGSLNFGTIFKIKPDGSNYTKLLDFADSATSGSTPASALFYDGTFLYGTTQFGGAYSQGTIFKIKPDGTGYTDLMDFTGAANGGNPNGYLIYDGTFLYGMTTSGGTNSDGTVFKIKPDGTGYAKLLDFTGASNGESPYASLVTDGTYLYGMTGFGGANNDGTIFKIKPDGTGYVKLVDFGDTINGRSPYGTLSIEGTVIYGMTHFGGTNDLGTIFKLDGVVISGIEEYTINNNVKVYPNPATGIINVEYETQPQICKAEVVDILGNEVMHVALKQGKTQIDVSSLTKGFYLIKIDQSVQKFIKL